jgi:hypothetical protein
MRHLFGYKGVFDFNYEGEIVREKWNSYPQFLKHTIFHTGEDVQKARLMEIGHKFFIVDKLREKGNRKYRKGQFPEAIQFYERVQPVHPGHFHPQMALLRSRLECRSF